MLITDLKDFVNQKSDIDKLIVGPATEDFIKNYTQKYDVDEIKKEINQTEAEYPFLFKVGNNSIWIVRALCVVVFLLYTYLWNILVALIYSVICSSGLAIVDEKLTKVLYSDQARALVDEYNKAYKNDKPSK